MIAVVGTLAWEFQVSLPLMASHVFGGGAAAYGVMASVMGVGAVVGRPGLGGAGAAERPRALPGRDRLGDRHPGGRGRAVDAARAGGAAVRRVRLDHVQLDGQDGAAARRHAGDARPGDGPVGSGLARLDPDRRARSSAGSARRRAPAGRSWSAACPPLVFGLLALPALVKIDRRRGDPFAGACGPCPAGCPHFAGTDAWLRLVSPCPSGPIETSDANTTTELR